jgi:hypothetical protein
MHREIDYYLMDSMLQQLTCLMALVDEEFAALEQSGMSQKLLMGLRMLLNGMLTRPPTHGTVTDTSVSDERTFSATSFVKNALCSSLKNN